MNFLNPALAWGALAFSIPLILHIMNRSRFRRIEWGAMHLLESVVKVNHRRFHLEQLILLLVRCAIPALLAMTLAKPVLTGAQAPAGEAPVSMVILLDTSYSMDATGESSTRFEQAIEAASSIVSATSRGSEIAVIQTGGVPTPMFDQPVFDPDAVVRRLKTLQAGYGASDMAAALDAGLVALSGMNHARQELIVISDFQSADWNAVDEIRTRIDAMSIKPELTLLPVGQPVGGNIAIESLDFAARPLGVGQPLSVRASVRNYGSQSLDQARVVLKVDGVEHSVTQLALAAGATSQTLFSCEFAQPGSHVIEVLADVKDPLKTDNQLAAAVTVWDQIKVLLVDGDPSSQALKGETDFLTVALTPFSFSQVKLTDLVQTQTVTADKLQPELLKDTRVVVLANVPKLNDAQVGAIREYVEGGGALLVAAGNRIDSKWYNETLFRNGTDLLPAEYGKPLGKIDDQGASSRIIAQHFDSPALQFFNDTTNGDLSMAEIRQWYQLNPHKAETTPENGTPSSAAPSSAAPSSGKSPASDSFVLARLATGDALFIERSFGDGVVVQMATACDSDWSDLPMRPFYVPLMQQLITTMAAQLTPPRNIRTGEAAVVLFPAPAAPVANSQDVTPTAAVPAEAVLSIVTPEGARRSLTAVPQGNLLMARFDGTRRPGTYAMTLPDAAVVHFVASTTREESDLSILDDDGIRTLAEKFPAKFVKTTAEYLELDRLRRDGREIWRFVLAGFLAFLFLELVLQQRFARVRT